MVATSSLAGSGILDTVDIASQMAKMKAGRYTFGNFDRDDICQELWLAVHKASGKYDPSKVKRAISFFNIATENAMKNLRRDNKSIEFLNLHDMPILHIDNSDEEKKEATELLSYILHNIPPKWHDALSKMIEGNGREVPYYLKSKIRDRVERLLRRLDNE